MLGGGDTAIEAWMGWAERSYQKLALPEEESNLHLEGNLVQILKCYIHLVSFLPDVDSRLCLGAGTLPSNPGWAGLRRRTGISSAAGWASACRSLTGLQQGRATSSVQKTKDSIGNAGLHWNCLVGPSKNKGLRLNFNHSDFGPKS